MVEQDLTCYDIAYWHGLHELCTEDDGEPLFSCKKQMPPSMMLTWSAGFSIITLSPA